MANYLVFWRHSQSRIKRGVVDATSASEAVATFRTTHGLPANPSATATPFAGNDLANEYGSAAAYTIPSPGGN